MLLNQCGARRDAELCRLCYKRNECFEQTFNQGGILIDMRIISATILRIKDLFGWVPVWILAVNLNLEYFFFQLGVDNHFDL